MLVDQRFLLDRGRSQRYNILYRVRWGGHVISTTLKAGLGVLPVLLILGLREYSRKCYTTFAGVLPQKCCSASGSTPVLKKQSVGPLLREYSRKSGPTILPGVLPKRLFLYTGSDLDMIYNLDILLPLDTLGVLPVLLFLVSGSTPGRLIFCQWKWKCLLYKNKSIKSTPRTSKSALWE